jgi:signal transduction histidine kinase/ActR/RegA family two-component response regulator
MHQPSRFLRKKELIAIFGIALFLTGFVGFLLVSNYRSLQKLRNSAKKQYEYEFEQRCWSLEHFLENQRQKVTSTTNDGKLDLYFENKALGMSMQYGLRSTLLALNRELSQFVGQQRIGDKIVYQKLAIYDELGTLIAESDTPSLTILNDQHWRQSLHQLPEGFYAIQPTEKTDQYFIYTRPYLFKAKYVAQIVAIFSIDAIRSHFLKAGQAALFTGLFAPSTHLITIRSNNTALFPPPTDQILLPEDHYPIWVTNFKESESILTFQKSIGKTRLQLKEIASANMIIGVMSPGTLLLAMALLFIGLLGAATLIMRMVAHNLVLQTRVEESIKREKDIARKNKQLRAEIEERKRSESARIQLEVQLQRIKKMEAIGMLAGGVAHDLNNILTGIVSYPDLLLMQLPENSSLRDPILTIKKSGEKATAIVQDLLTLARRGVVVNDIINLNTIVTEYLKSPEHQKILSFHNGVRVITDFEENLFNIEGSSVHISKSIMNLVSNAAEAMPEGGEITISTKAVYIDHPIGNYEKVNEGEYVLLSVSDTGSGMSIEDSEKIFEPFFTKKKMGRSGTGLGMSVVWGTVKDHKGYIDVQTELGTGTTFYLYFPVSREKLKVAEPASHIEEYKGNGETILVADDVKEQRDIAQRIFSELGYTVNTAESGEKAVEYVAKNAVDVIVLDMIMAPGIDGLETYERILKLHPGQKAIITSGFSETDRIRKCKEIGIKQYIKKPYTIEKIAQAVRAELGSC